MIFALPLAAILLLPALLAWWMLGRQGHGRWWRLLVLLLLVAAASGPSLRWGDGGSDVVLVIDRSASMPFAERSAQEELVRLVAEQRQARDRLAVVAVGNQVAIAQRPSTQQRPRLADAGVDPLGSAIGEGLETALALVPPGRSARIILHSDGDHTDADPMRAAARLAAAAIAVDVLTVARPALPDAAIIDVELPGELRLGESFIGAIRVLSDQREERRWRVLREGRVLAEGVLALEPGLPSVATFADRPDRTGLNRYVAEIEGAEGFARAARIDRQRLSDELRQATSSGLAGLATTAAGIDPAQIERELSTLLAQPAVVAVLDLLADPARRGEHIQQLHDALATKLPAPVVGVVVRELERILSLSVVGDDDRQPLNNRARGAIRVEGGERVLVMSGDGSPGNVARALTAAGLTVRSRAEGPIDLSELSGASVLILDNVPADRLGITGLTAIARWTEHLGGGLVMLGGRRSFGAGGYHRSAVEEVLPVTMELRDEHRKLACSIAISIDTSGSMSVPVADGRMKLELAAEGAAAVIELLGPRDQVAVFGVDSAPITVLPLQPVDNPEALVNQVIGIQPGGGGIYVYEALVAAGEALLDSGSGTRHLVLFADANDAEAPGDYQQLLADFVAAGISVSVIGLGNDRDADSALLMEIAERGGGRCTFAEAAEDIPRLFAQETMLVARSAWIDQTAPLVKEAGLDLVLGSSPALAGPWPQTNGYNLTYVRERANVLTLAAGDPQAPAIAAWRIGTGRSVAVALDCDDDRSAELLAWDGYAPLIAGLVRWCAGSGDQDQIGRLSASRVGRDAIFRLELDPDQRERWPSRPPQLALVADGALGAAAAPTLQPVEDGVWEARHAMANDQAIIPAADIEDQALLGPALCLPYPAEAEPRFDRRSGADVLEAISRSTGGKLRSDVLDAYANPPSAGQHRDLTPILIILAILILVLEILVRRLRLGWPTRRANTEPVLATPARTAVVSPPAAPPRAPPTPAASAPAAQAPDAGLHEALRQLRRKR